MNKIKSLFLAVALILGVGAAYAFSVADEPPCFVPNTVGYSSPYTPDGTPPDPESSFAYAGLFNPEEDAGITTYRCVEDPITCRFVYAVTAEAPQGRWFTCTGIKTQNSDPE